MSKRKGLGRGLGALIPGDAATASGKSAATAVDEKLLRTVPVSSIRPNPYQPRTEFDADLLSELAGSIKEHGLIQPLIVTEDSPGKYTLIAGERRWRACQLASIEEVMVVVKEATPQSMMELAIIENIQREDLSPIEEALAYKHLMEEYNFTQMQVVERMNKTKARSTIANLLRLLELPQEIQEAINNNEISGRHGRALLSLDSLDDQMTVFNSIISLDLNVRQTENLIESMRNKTKSGIKVQRRESPEILALQESFRELLGQRVDLTSKKGKGKLIIHFDSDEELNNIYDHINKNG